MPHKMAASQIECSRLEQKSVIKFSLIKKLTPCEIYKKMRDVYREASFSLKILTN